MKIDRIGDPLIEIEPHIYFAGIVAEVDRIAPRSLSLQGDHQQYQTEMMVRILVLKRLYNLSDEWLLSTSCSIA